MGCEYEAPISYNSCRSRCCPKCGAQARQRWLEAQQRDLLDTNYFHLVFTVPHDLNPLALTTSARFFDLLFAASSQTLLEAAADPKRLGAEIGFLSSCTHGARTCSATITSTASFPPADFGRPLALDPYPSPLPAAHPVLRTVFRKKFLDGLRQLYRKGLLDCRGPAADFQYHARFEELAANLGQKRCSFMPSLPSAARPMSCATSDAILTASPSPTIACWPSTDSASVSAGGVMLTAANSAS